MLLLFILRKNEHFEFADVQNCEIWWIWHGVFLIYSLLWQFFSSWQGFFDSGIDGISDYFWWCLCIVFLIIYEIQHYLSIIGFLVIVPAMDGINVSNFPFIHLRIAFCLFGNFCSEMFDIFSLHPTLYILIIIFC